MASGSSRAAGPRERRTRRGAAEEGADRREVGGEARCLGHGAPRIGRRCSSGWWSSMRTRRWSVLAARRRAPARCARWRATRSCRRAAGLRAPPRRPRRDLGESGDSRASRSRRRADFAPHLVERRGAGLVGVAEEEAHPDREHERSGDRRERRREQPARPREVGGSIARRDRRAGRRSPPGWRAGDRAATPGAKANAAAARASGDRPAARRARRTARG